MAYVPYGSLQVHSRPTQWKVALQFARWNYGLGGVYRVCQKSGNALPENLQKFN